MCAFCASFASRFGCRDIPASPRARRPGYPACPELGREPRRAQQFRRYHSVTPTTLACNERCKFAPLFSIISKMLLPQPLSFQAFAWLPGGAMGYLSTTFKHYLNSRFPNRLLACSLCPLPSLCFQQPNYPTRIVRPERSEGSLYVSFCFQRVPTIKFCNSSVLITIWIAGGGGSPFALAPLLSVSSATSALRKHRCPRSDFSYPASRRCLHSEVPC